MLIWTTTNIKHNTAFLLFFLENMNMEICGSLTVWYIQIIILLMLYIGMKTDTLHTSLGFYLWQSVFRANFDRLRAVSHQGPVVQSILSLKKSLVEGLLSLTVLIKSVASYFLLKKCAMLLHLHCKSTAHFFSKKRQCFLVLYIRKLNVSSWLALLLVLNNRAQTGN